MNLKWHGFTAIIVKFISNVGGVDLVSLLKTLDSESTAANGNRYCAVAFVICTVNPSGWVHMYRFYRDVRLVANGFHLCQKIGNVYNYLVCYICSYLFL